MRKCHICKSTNVEVLKDVEDIQYKKNTLQVEIEYSECSSCGREFISQDQITKNDKAIREAKKSFDGLLSSQKIVEAREKLNLTQEQASKIFGGGRNAFSKYERGEVSQSASMDKLIRMALSFPFIFNELLHVENLQPKVKMKDIASESNVVFYDTAKKERMKIRDTQYNFVKKVEISEVLYG